MGERGWLRILGINHGSDDWERGMKDIMKKERRQINVRWWEGIKD